MRLLALLIKEWRLLLRDLHALAVLFLMPLAFVLLMAFALSDLNATTPATPAISLQADASDNHSVFFAAALAAQIPLAEAAPERVKLKVPADFAARLGEDGAELVQLIFPAKTPAIIRQQVRAAVNISLAHTRLHSCLLSNELLRRSRAWQSSWRWYNNKRTAILPSRTRAVRASCLPGLTLASTACRPG